MSLADACLVRMSEMHPSSPVFTLDDDDEWRLLANEADYVPRHQGSRRK